EQGGSISDVLWSGPFTRMRAWQTDQRGNYGRSEVKNLFCPCPIRDHHQFAEQLITDHEVRPLDPDAEAAYGDAEYHRRMREYDNRLRRLLDPMWEEEFETTEEAEKERAGTM
ncbi:MAG: hypothetical protein ACLFUM_09625, partial [Spirochaetaceae bacterium]